MRLYGVIEKVEPQDDGTVRVHGIATSEAVDDQGEVVKAEAMRAALPGYFRAPALREMHQLSAAGTTLEAEVGDDGVTRIVAHVIDPIAVLKVRKQVYRGFSIGGQVTQRDSANRKVITGLTLNEISLVDRPANPEAIFDCWKATAIEGITDMPEGLATIGDTAAGQKLAAALAQPVQIWSCGLAEHQHAAKAEALKCIEKRAAAEVGEGEGAIAKGDEPGVVDQAEKAADNGEAPAEGAEADQADTATGDPAEKAAAADAGETGEPEVAAEAPDAAEIEKLASEGAGEAQAAIDVAMKAIERGEAVLADPAVVEKAAGEGEVPEAEVIETAATETVDLATEQTAKAGAAAAETPATETAADQPETTGAVTKADDSKKPYGDVSYADSGLQSDGKHRYPIDTEAHIRSAWNYINKPSNCAKYSNGDCAKVKAKIVAAWKAKIDKDGPPSAAKASGSDGLLKSMYDLGDVASAILFWDGLAERLKWEAMLEDDSSDAAVEAAAIRDRACAFLRNLVSEETGELMAGTELDDGDAGFLFMADLPGNLRKAGLDAIADQIEKAGARHSAQSQMMLDAAYECTTKAMGIDGCTKAMGDNLACAADCMKSAGARPWAEAGSAAEKAATTMAMDILGKAGSHKALMDMAHDCLGKMTGGGTCNKAAKAGAKHSAETMNQLGKAHDYLCAAGANCDMHKDDMGGDDMAMAAKAVGTGSPDLLVKAAGTLDALAKTVGDLRAELAEARAENAKMAAEVTLIKNTPLPPVAIARSGTASITKAQDGGGSAEQGFSEEAMLKRYAAMSSDEKVLFDIKASHLKPFRMHGMTDGPAPLAAPRIYPTA